MLITRKNLYFGLLLTLLLMAISVSAQKDKGDNASAINFPEIEGWQKLDKTIYPAAQLGYSLGYKARNGETVTIYVYNGGKKKIADGVDDKNVQAEIKKAEGDIEEIGRQGHYIDVKKIKDGTVTLGGATGKTKSLHSMYNFKLRGNPVESEIYLFGYQNNFIKIRVTRPKTTDGAESAAFNQLLIEIDKVLSK